MSGLDVMNRIADLLKERGKATWACGCSIEFLIKVDGFYIIDCELHMTGFHKQNRNKDKIYPCESCGILRSKDEGGNTFTVCNECQNKNREDILKAMKNSLEE